MSSPPPPYSIQPPPAYVRPLPRRKSNPVSRRPTARPSSREMLTRALYLAQQAVELDASESDMPAAIAAYDEAIALLQSVIAQRSQNPGRASEVMRVTEIHNRYSDRVRELCQARCIPLPPHVVPAPPSAPASRRSPAEFPPQAMPSSLPRQGTSVVAPQPTNGISLEPLQVRRLRSSPTLPTQTEDEPDWVPLPELSPSSSTSSTFETSLPISPLAATATAIPTTDATREDDVEEEGGDDTPDKGRQWIWAAARDEELKEWGQYLDEERENCRLSIATADSSALWSVIANSHGESVCPSSDRKSTVP